MEIAVDVSEFDYAENFPPPGKSAENGLIPGLFLSYLRQGDVGSDYGTLSLEYSPGGTRYSGTSQPDNLPLQQSTTNTFLRAEGDYGLHLWRGLHAYGGLGIRYWARGTSRFSDGVASPAEDYLWLYLPVGLRLRLPLGERWELDADASLRWMFWGRITVRYSELGLGYQDASASLGGALGGRVEFPLAWKISDRFGIEGAPWLEYSTIGQSGVFEVVQNGETTAQGMEPSSRTYQFGARVGATVRY